MRSICWRRSSWVTIVLLLHSAASHGLPEDLDLPADLADETLRQGIFGYTMTWATARRQADTRLDAEISYLERRTALSDDQRRKLRLAGRADILDFFEQLNSLKSRFAHEPGGLRSARVMLLRNRFSGGL